jgi:hypothetical protein
MSRALAAGSSLSEARPSRLIGDALRRESVPSNETAAKAGGREKGERRMRRITATIGTTLAIALLAPTVAFAHQHRETPNILKRPYGR